MVIQGVSYLSDFEAKKAIIETAARLEAKGHLVAGDGSLSVRVGPNAVWVTVAGADKAALTQDMLVRVDLNGKQMASAHPKPLSEDIAAHLKIYRENEAVQSVLHAYPVCAAVLGMQGRGVEPARFSPSVRALGRMQLLSVQSPEALADAVAPLSRTDKGVLLQNDGCMTWGKTPAEAAQMISALDYYCRVMARLGRKPCTCGRSASGFCDGSCKRAAPPAPVCSGDCIHCSGAATCPVCGQALPVPARPVPVQPIPAPVQELPLNGVTGLIHPGEALPPLPPKQSAAPAPAASAAPAVPATSPAPVTAPVVQEPAKPVAVIDVPKADVMAEVVRRMMQSF